MKKLMSVLLILGSLLINQAAFARDEPLVDPGTQTVFAGNTDIERLKTAIRAGARVHNWNITREEPEQFRMTVTSRGKYSAIVDVKIVDAQSVQIVYVDSMNLNYGVRDGQPVIHPTYNRWVNNLLQAIRFGANTL